MNIYITSSEDFYKDQVIYNLFETGICQNDTIFLSTKKMSWHEDLQSMAERYNVPVKYHRHPDSFCDKSLYLNNQGYHEIITLEF